MKLARFLTASTVAALLAGCAATVGDPSDGGTPASLDATSERPEVSPMAEEVPADVLEPILADAARRAGVEQSEIRVTAAESVTWSDGSIGCPEPGMMYTQALVPGYRVVVEAGGEELHVHATESGDFRFCDDPQPPASDGTVDR